MEKPKILLVDDQLANLFALEKILSTLDVGTVKASSGNEALELTLSHEFALVLLDVQMPGMDGYEVARFLRSEERTGHIPIIFITAIDRSEQFELKGYRTGAVDFIFKPVNREMLLSKVEVFLDLHRTKTALIEMNKDLEATNLKLKRTNKELAEFAHIVAHDLKTPLRGIGTLADWLVTDYADKFDEQGKEQVNMLVTKSKQMSALIDDILEYSRLGRECPDTEQVDLNVILSDVIAAVDPPDNIEITVDGELPAIACERTHILQVFQNLVSNAVKYMDKPEGRVTIGCVEQEHFWKFSVADNGPGIDEKYFEKIFQIFQTLSPREGVESTGIGLSIVRKVADLHAGNAWVESEVGKGSTFFFTMSKRSADAPVIPAENGMAT